MWFEDTVLEIDTKENAAIMIKLLTPLKGMDKLLW